VFYSWITSKTNFSLIGFQYFNDCFSNTDWHHSGARVVLVDDNGIRATMTASWLKQMGWADVAALTMDKVDGAMATGPHVPKLLGFDEARVSYIDAVTLRDKLTSGKTVVVDLDYSRQYRQGHIPGAYFSTRARLGKAMKKLPKAEAIVLTSPDGALAWLAAADIAEKASTPVFVLSGGTKAWTAAGYALEEGATHMADEADDVWLSARELGKNREEAMREYLAWEIDLVHQMATDDDHRFNVVAG
jgi:rhodanese-related sulfurtransferase